MIYLDLSSRALQAVLAGNAATTQPVAHVGFYDVYPQAKVDFSEYRGSLKITNLSNSTDVNICSAPNQGNTRDVNFIHIYNADTASVTITVKIDDGGTDTILRKTVLVSTSTLAYEHGVGWQIL